MRNCPVHIYAAIPRRGAVFRSCHEVAGQQTSVITLSACMLQRHTAKLQAYIAFLLAPVHRLVAASAPSPARRMLLPAQWPALTPPSRDHRLRRDPPRALLRRRLLQPVQAADRSFSSGGSTSTSTSKPSAPSTFSSSSLRTAEQQQRASETAGASERPSPGLAGSTTSSKSSGVNGANGASVWQGACNTA